MGVIAFGGLVVEVDALVGKRVYLLEIERIVDIMLWSISVCG